jgi:hypothetical protein
MNYQFCGVVVFVESRQRMLGKGKIKMKKKENKRAGVRGALIWALALALVVTMLPASVFAGTTGDDGAYYADDTVPSAPDCTKVQWNGMTWDIIGYNTGTVEHGVTGPSQTATLLLDAGSYMDADRTAFDSSSSYSNEYAGSDLQAKMESFYVDDIADKTGIEPRDLEGGSGLSVSDGSGASGESAPLHGRDCGRKCGYRPVSVAAVSDGGFAAQGFRTQVRYLLVAALSRLL